MTMRQDVFCGHETYLPYPPTQGFPFPDHFLQTGVWTGTGLGTKRFKGMGKLGNTAKHGTSTGNLESVRYNRDPNQFRSGDEQFRQLDQLGIRRVRFFLERKVR